MSKEEFPRARWALEGMSDREVEEVRKLNDDFLKEHAPSTPTPVRLALELYEQARETEEAHGTGVTDEPEPEEEAGS